MNLTEFLEARIAEDEADCAPDPDWDDYRGHCDTAGVHLTPERARAECAAKRAILALYKPEDAKEESWDPEAYMAGAYDDCIRALATVYADHPDYQQEWAPVTP